MVELLAGRSVWPGVRQMKRGAWAEGVAGPLAYPGLMHTAIATLLHPQSD